MDNTAIKAISDLALIDAANTVATDTPSVIIPKDAKVESLEHLMDKPSRFKAAYNTHILDEFVSYYQTHADDTETALFIDTDNMTATAIFDLGHRDDPHWGDHKAMLSLQKTPAFKALFDHNNTKLDQRDMIDFINDWGPLTIDFYSSENELIPLLQAVNRLRKLTVQSASKNDSEIDNFSSNKTAMESIEVTAGAEAIPAYFAFKTPPHDGFETAILKAELRALTDGKTVQLKYRIAGLEPALNDIANEFRDKLKANIDNGQMFIGTLRYG